MTAAIGTQRMFVSSLSDEQFMDGWRYPNEDLNKAMKEALQKKYFKKNGKPRKNSPYNVFPITPKEFLEPTTNPQ